MDAVAPDPETRRSLEQALPVLAEWTFPGEAADRWRVVDIVRKGDFYGADLVLNPPGPYPAYRMVVSRKAEGGWQDHAVFVLEGGCWHLLCTAPEASEAWRDLGFGQLDPPPVGRASKGEKEMRPRAGGAILLLMGLVFSGLGGMLMGEGLGLLPPSGRATVPLWVLAIAGLPFTLAGLGMLALSLRVLLTGAFPSGKNPLPLGCFVAVVTGAMAFLFGYGAFFGKARDFTSPETPTRLAFGLAAVLLGAIALVFGLLSGAGLLSLLREALRKEEP